MGKGQRYDGVVTRADVNLILVFGSRLLRYRRYTLAVAADLRNDGDLFRLVPLELASPSFSIRPQTRRANACQTAAKRHLRAIWLHRC